MEKCRMCNTRDANKTNSHIFPRFMAVSLLETGDGKRKGYTVGNKMDITKPRVQQDSPKESYILCDVCESYIGGLETVFSNKLIRKLKDPKHASEYCHQQYHGFNKTYLPTIANPELKICILSMLFRAHITSKSVFSNLILPAAEFETIRKILNQESPYLDFPMIILTSGDLNYTENYYYAHSSESGAIHLLWVNDYIFIIFLKPEYNKINGFNELLLKSEEPPFTGIIPPEAWNALRESLRTAVIANFKNENDR